MKIVNISLAILVFGVAASYWGINCHAKSNSNSLAVSSAPPTTAVDGLILQTQLIDEVMQVSGRVVASKFADIRPQVDGIIVQRLFEEGQYIEKGTQLYQIDDTQYKAGLAIAKANLEHAKADFALAESQILRYSNLIKRNAISQQDFENSQAELLFKKSAVEVARAQLQIAQQQLDYTKVYAPISGHIGRSMVTEGTLLSVSQPQILTTITQLNPAVVDLQESRKKSFKLQQTLLKDNQPLAMTVRADTDSGSISSQGQVKLAELSIQQSTDTVTFRGEVDNSHFYFLPGTFVTAQINLGQFNAILIPQKSAMLNSLGNLQVWLINKDNQAFPHELNVRMSYQDYWVVDSGINAGDKIIISGYQNLTSGDLVKPTFINDQYAFNS
ncbi:efflux RND transporter periplasmic adaptor subunit [Catenovulum sp. SX2]|uniref:efflux RND transporter periplasmic adaptor subunit n=1 Tax=Catenovulum sp. SX2 TaxID=3398614 RepID=UPI003F846263